jgi:hypothetical protein
MSNKTSVCSDDVALDDATVEIVRLPMSAVEGCDPYSSADSQAQSGKPRRTLDDMRQLSEDIKKGRGEK